MTEPEGWPSSAFDAPTLRPLDERARSDVQRAGRLLELCDGELAYRAGEPADAVFVVLSGEIRVAAVRRGDESTSELRVARQGDTFGEEATLPGAERWGTATAVGSAALAAIPIGVLVRALERSGGGAVVEREERSLKRRASHDLLRTVALARDLPEEDLEQLLDGVRWTNLPRHARLFGVGDVADAAYFVVSGLIQIQTEDHGQVQVRAYLGRGDLFGDEEALGRTPRGVHAVALGDCQLLEVPGTLLRAVVDRNPGLAPRMRRLRSERELEQREIVGRAAAHSTQHVFHDLYRMQMARSLLAIDQDSCVRCGHCAWSCAETHDGVARLVRRGDKIVTQLATVSGSAKSLMLPNSCQHCHNPACMIDCPTGAIGRDPEGEVFIREPLCTGCGACAKACPWENILMAPRHDGEHAEVAIKCDLCRDFSEPVCVSACPTESIVRLDPQRDFAEVRGLLGAAPGKGEQGRTTVNAGSLLRVAPKLALTFCIVGIGVASRFHSLGILTPGRGLAYAAGIAAALATVALALHSLPKRRLRPKPSSRPSAARRVAEELESPTAQAPPPRSRLAPLVSLHVTLGLVALVGVALHTGARIGGGIAGTLAIAFWLTAALGAGGALLYRVLPRRLSALERRGALPEDLKKERELLFDRLHRATTGKSELVKAIAGRILVPYARAPLGAALLLASGRDLGAERKVLRARVDALLEGRGAERLEGLEELTRIVVELRALPARRALTLVLRGWLVLHVIGSALLLVLLVLHVVGMVRW